MINILAIDQAPCLSGVCRLQVDGDKTVRECLSLNPGKRVGMPRLSWYRDWLNDELCTGANLLVLEGMSYGKQGNISAQVGLATILEFTAWRLSIPVLTVVPVHLKMWATGRGAGDKDGVYRAAIDRWGLDEIHNPDEADAAWLAEIGYAYHIGDKGSNDARRRVLGILRGEISTKPARKKSAKEAV